MGAKALVAVSVEPREESDPCRQKRDRLGQKRAKVRRKFGIHVKSRVEIALKQPKMKIGTCVVDRIP